MKQKNQQIFSLKKKKKCKIPLKGKKIYNENELIFEFDRDLYSPLKCIILH